MPTRYMQNVNPQGRFAIWAWSPVIVLRVALVAGYLISVYASTWAFIAGVPVFRLTAPEGYAPVWAVLLGTSAVVAAVGSTTDRWQKVEKWATAVLSVMWAAYVIGMNVVGFALGDLDRQFLGSALLGLLVLPVTRFVYLAAQSGKKKRVPGGR